MSYQTSSRITVAFRFRDSRTKIVFILDDCRSQKTVTLIETYRVVQKVSHGLGKLNAHNLAIGSITRPSVLLSRMGS